MTQANSPRMRQLVDWRAALWAGLIAGAIFLLLNLLLVAPALELDAASFMRLQSAPILGGSASTANFFVVLIIGLLTHFVLAIGASLVLAFLIHRWGLIVGILGGALFGLALYFINFTLGSILAIWLFALRGTAMMISHIVFGALAGGIYEALEVEEFTPVEE